MARRIVLLLLALLVVTVSPELYAQKKKAPKEQVTVPQTKPTPAFRDWLAQQVGVATSRGMLQKVGPDYFIVEEDGVQTVIPLMMVQSIKVKKEKEDEDKPEKTTLVIKLVSGD
jgi:hypothetical protein